MDQTREPLRGKLEPGFAHRLESFGDRTALVGENGRVLSYAELAERADAFARRLGPQRRLLNIQMANEVDAVVALLGALRHGHAILLTAPGEAGERIGRTFSPDAVFAKAAERWTLSLRPGPAAELHPALALLLPTSGTTGSPRLVRLSATGLEANARSIAEFLGIGPDQRPITSLPLHYSYGLSVLTSHLSRGATVLLTGRSVADPAFWTFFDREEATSMAGVPYTYELLERIGFLNAPHPSLRRLTQAGGRLPPEAVSRYSRWAKARGVDFFVMYGQTEATARIAYLPPDQLGKKPGAIGVAIPGGALRLVDDQGREITAPDTPGELIYRGANVMMGYALERADLAKGFELDELATGDLATRDAEGVYTIVGRKSRFVKLFGLRVSLDDLEAALAAKGIRATVTGDDSLIAVAVGREAKLAAAVGVLTGRFALPADVFQAIRMDEFPRLPSGKIDYAAILQAAYAARGPAANDRSGAQAVIEIFQRTFPQAKLEPGDSFVSLGGDSLRYVTLSLALERVLGTLPQPWEELSIAELQAMADEATAVDPAPWRLRPIETEMIIRAIAALAVVVVHASHLQVTGGADILLMLVGYNLARYQRGRLASKARWEVLTGFLRRIFLPYYVILIAYQLFKHRLDLPGMLGVSNYFGRFDSFVEPYWFLEALAQALLLTILLFCVAPIRRFATARPWGFGMVLLGLAVAVRMAAYATFHHDHLSMRTLDSVYYLVALGWCLRLARTPVQRVAFTAATTGLCILELKGVPGLWQILPPPASVTHALSLLAAAVLILYVPVTQAPSWIRSAIGAVAGASFYIYLTHNVPVHLLSVTNHITAVAPNLAAALAVGLSTAWVATWLRQRWSTTATLG
ncbi:MAG: non-ribosomal peptide synthetase [Proteobacteria bacterium]|nr:non-ribosomal peptide synthetase [Pseudomonadota bacterium]